VTLPAGITPTSSTAGCTTAGAVITCTPALAAGANQAFTFTLLIGPNTTGQGRAITASVTSDSIADTNPANNQASLPLRLPPVLQVPPDVTISSCASPNIGQATATAEDGGPVVISNDAPAVFPVGVTIVTWTATDSRGVQATGQQRVTAVLGDDASCCPMGSNVIRGTAGDDVLAGTAGTDCIIGLGGGDVISGLGGNDVLSGGAGSDVIDGGDGNDTVFGGPGLNSLHGGAGDDLVVGGDDSEVVTGGDGNDRLQGHGGNDNISGGAGNDVVEGGAGTDVCSAAPGQDVVLSCAP
jgi:Ca2+-binding RTX toxin-like protein